MNLDSRRIKDRLREKHEKLRREDESIQLRIEEERKVKEKNLRRLEEVNKKLEQMAEEKQEMFILASKIDQLADKIERSRLQEYLDLVNNKKKLLYVNFLMGMAKGLGTIIGVTVLAALVIYVLRSMISLPIIGKFIAEIIEIVQENLAAR